MKIVTTPMCKDVMLLAGVRDFEVNPDPDSTDADIAVVLSETDTTIKSVKLKLNTFSQIKESIKILRNIFEIDLDSYKPEDCTFHGINKSKNRKIKVKVYSNFLNDIVDDLGYTVVSKDHDYLVYPDYLRDQLSHEIIIMGDKGIEVPSHKNAPKDAIKRAKMRYNFLEKNLCTKP
jgi:hypothetical protein